MKNGAKLGICQNGFTFKNSKIIDIPSTDQKKE